MIDLDAILQATSRAYQILEIEPSTFTQRTEFDQRAIATMIHRQMTYHMPQIVGEVVSDTDFFSKTDTDLERIEQDLEKIVNTAWNDIGLLALSEYWTKRRLIDERKRLFYKNGKPDIDKIAEEYIWPFSERMKEIQDSI